MSDKLVKTRAGRVPVAYAPGFEAGGGLVYGQEPREPSVVAEIWGMLWRRKWTLLASLLIVLAVAVVVTWRLPRTYDSTVNLLIGSGAASKNVDLPTMDVLNQLGLPSDIQTELQLLQSRSIVEPVVDDNDLNVVVLLPSGKRPGQILPGFQATRSATVAGYAIKPAGAGIEIRRTWPSDSAIGTFTPGQHVETAGLAFDLPAKLPAPEIDLQVNDFETAVSSVRGQVYASLPNEDATVITLGCYANSPAQAQLLCKGVSESYVALRNSLQRSDAVHAADFLRVQSDSVSGELAKAEKELETYQQENQVVAPDVQASSEVQQFADLQAKRDELRGERSALTGFLSQVEKGQGADRYRQLAAFPTFINNPMVSDIVKNLMTYENQLHELSQRRTDENPDVIALRQRISDLEGQLGGMARNYESALGRQVSAIDQNLGQARGRLTSVPAKEIEVARLQRRRDLLTTLYTTLQQRLAEAQIAQAIKLADVSIIDQASLPLEPSSPNLMLNLALGGAAGLLLGIVVALLQEFADTRLRRRGEVERESGLPVLTMIPWVKGEGVIGRTDRKLLGRRAPRDAPPLADYYPARGDLIEAFRSLGADLSFGEGTGLAGNVRTLVFTSPWRGEGKTFSAVNFAATRALQGARTLLIDGDMRGGSAGAALGLDHAPGLSDVLAGDVDLLDAIRMVKVGEHRLAVLGVGELPEDPGALLEPERVQAVLAAAGQEFEQVIVDTPPLNLVSDASVFAACADAVVLVVRSGRTDREALDLTLARLGRVGARPVGILLNDVKMPSASKYTYTGSAGYAPAERKAS